MNSNAQLPTQFESGLQQDVAQINTFLGQQKAKKHSGCNRPAHSASTHVNMCTPDVHARLTGCSGQVLSPLMDVLWMSSRLSPTNALASHASDRTATQACRQP
jgi:hypothetical protein